MRRELPKRPDLEHLKKQAKDLLDDARSRKPEAFTRIRAGLPALANATDAQIEQASFALHDAQSVVAREYGFHSYAELKEHVDTTERSALIAQIMANVTTMSFPEAVLRSMAEQRSAPARSLDLSRALPLLPVRNALVTAGSTVPLHVARARTLSALAVARREHHNMVAVFAQRDPENLEPGAADLHDTGCVAWIADTLPSEGETQWVVLLGITWVQLRSLHSHTDHTLVEVSALKIEAPSDAQIKPLADALRRAAKELAARLFPGTQAQKLIDQVDDPMRLADLVMSNLPGTVEDKARFAAETDARARLTETLAAVRRMLAPDPDADSNQ